MTVTPILPTALEVATDVAAALATAAGGATAATPATAATDGATALATDLLQRGSPGTIEALQALLGQTGLAVFRVLTRLGEGVVVAPALALYYLRWGDRDDAAVAAATALAALALVEALKAAFGLPRPPAALHAAPAEGSGFPSGHALGAAAVWGALAALDRRWSARRRFAAAGAVVAAVAVSRVALGVHYPVDVVAGVAAGAVLAGVVVATCRDRPLAAFGVAAALGGLALAVAGPTVDVVAAAGGAVGGAATWWGLPERPTLPRVGWPAATAALAVVAAGWLAADAVGMGAPGRFVVAGAAVATVLWTPVAARWLRVRPGPPS